MLMESIADLEQIAEFLEELQKLKPKNDDKLQQLIKLLKSDPVLKQHKVIIFTEYVTTARYLRQQARGRGIEGLDQVDSLTKRARDRSSGSSRPTTTSRRVPRSRSVARRRPASSSRPTCSPKASTCRTPPA